MECKGGLKPSACGFEIQSSFSNGSPAGLPIQVFPMITSPTDIFLHLSYNKQVLLFYELNISLP